MSDKCELCNGYGGWMDGDGPLAYPVPCPNCSEEEENPYEADR